MITPKVGLLNFYKRQIDTAKKTIAEKRLKGIPFTDWEDDLTYMHCLKQKYIELGGNGEEVIG